MCDKEYIGRYKDQKAYSYWDSGFVGPINIYETCTRKNNVFLYSSVKASQAMTDDKEVWIAINKKSQTKNEILCAWCSCMSGAYETYNHVIACLYKAEYANTKGFCNPSCTEQACAWNQGRKKEVAPKRIADLFVRTRSAISENKTVDKIPREEARRKDHSSFDPRAESHRQINSDDVSNFFFIRSK